MDERTDTELMELVARRNTLALKTLYQRYEMQIFNFILRYTGSREIARELLQDTFTRVWVSARTYDVMGGQFKGWLYTIALNLCRSEMGKKEYTYTFLQTGESLSPLAEEPDRNPENQLEQEERKRLVTATLGKLRPHLREVIIMKNFQHLTFKEIAVIEGLPESTLKARYHRAIAELKKTLPHLQG